MDSYLLELFCYITLGEMGILFLIIVREIIGLIEIAKENNFLKKEKAKITKKFNDFKESKENIQLRIAGIIPDLDEDGLIIEEETDEKNK